MRNERKEEEKRAHDTDTLEISPPADAVRPGFVPYYQLIPV